MTPLALDIAIGLLIALSTIVAYMRGIIKEVFTVAGLFVAVFFAYAGGHILVPTFNQWLHVPDGADTDKAKLVLGLLTPSLAAKVASYGGTFLLFFFVMMLLGHMIKRWVSEAGLSIVDRLIGGLFGFVRGFLLVFLLYVPATYLIGPEKMPAWVKESYGASVLQKTLDWVNEKFELNKNVEDRGGGIAIKLPKIDIDKLTSDIKPAEEELKKAISEEEKNIQKGVPEQPAQLMQKLEENQGPAPEAAPAPVVVPGTAPSPAPAPEAAPAPADTAPAQP